MLLRVGRVVAGVVALVLAASAAFPLNARGPRPGAGGCPVSSAGGWERGDRPGELVPADGAVSVTMCELPLPSSQGQAAGAVKRLTDGVGAMVSELNGLPTRDALEAELRRRESAKGRVLGDDLHLGEICTLVGYGTSLSFVVHYGNVRRPAVVLVDRNCGTARYAGRTRFGDPSDAFLRRYRAQLEARPALVRLPGCADALPAADIDLTRPRGWPRDDVAANRGFRWRALLPSPLSAAAACRYRLDGDVLRLRAQARVPDDLESVRSLLNVSTAVDTVTDRGGTESVTNATDCGLGRFTRPAALDVVWVGDTTGAVAEVRVWRAPCRAVYAGSTGGRIPTAELLSRLDAWLGR
ncbi:hypothetical protein ACIBK9_15325 [Nonomuraea sp. NPDC050227]|uniref:hypothetical protein n=1 Tax=Nonomuraea sp. NPDC050227 TaxID=3364360 RepID=UPI00379923A5